MSSQSTTPAQMDTASIHAEATALAAVDQQIASDSTRLGAVIRDLLEVCGASIGRKAISPKLTQDAAGAGESAQWAGIRFAGGHKQSHTGQGHTTWQWSIGGQSCYITSQARVYLIDWDGKATDFSGCAGYMDDYTSDVTVDELEQHLDAHPESAVEIVEALRKLVANDHRARKTIAAEMTAVLARLATA